MVLIAISQVNNTAILNVDNNFIKGKRKNRGKRIS